MTRACFFFSSTRTSLSPRFDWRWVLDGRRRTVVMAFVEIHAVLPFGPPKPPPLLLASVRHVPKERVGTEVGGDLGSLLGDFPQARALKDLMVSSLDLFPGDNRPRRRA